jgi:hypothetical protein
MGRRLSFADLFRGKIFFKSFTSIFFFFLYLFHQSFAAKSFPLVFFSIEKRADLSFSARSIFFSTPPNALQCPNFQRKHFGRVFSRPSGENRLQRVLRLFTAIFFN